MILQPDSKRCEHDFIVRAISFGTSALTSRRLGRLRVKFGISELAVVQKCKRFLWKISSIRNGRERARILIFKYDSL